MKMVNYSDITLNMTMKKTYPIKYVCKYLYRKDDETIIIFNKSNAKFDTRKPKSDEMRTINTLRNKLGWNIEVLYRINEDGISTPDIRRIQGGYEYWDIKNIYASISTNSKKEKLLHRISKQCDNFIFDLNNTECDLTNEEALEQIHRIYIKKSFLHVNMIVLLEKEGFIKVYKRK